jgi:hypothetical protein
MSIRIVVQSPSAQPAKPKGRFETLRPQDHLEDWHDVVNVHTSRKLSVSTDRLPALSGIAERYKKTLQNGMMSLDYCAGLWRQYLPRDLFWSVEPVDQTADNLGWERSVVPRPLEYPIPRAILVMVRNQQPSALAWSF